MQMKPRRHPETSNKAVGRLFVAALAVLLGAALATTAAAQETSGATDEATCPVPKTRVAAACAADAKAASADCDASAKASASECAAERDECLEAEQAARGVGPARASECAPKFQRCTAAVRRARAACGLGVDNDKGRCLDELNVRASECDLEMADDKARKKARIAYCRAVAQSTVNECTRTASVELRKLADDRDQAIEQCNFDEDPGCARDQKEACRILSEEVTRPRDECIREAQDAVLPCIREE